MIEYAEVLKEIIEFNESETLKKILGNTYKDFWNQLKSTNISY
jgi:hypothetical protein